MRNDETHYVVERRGGQFGGEWFEVRAAPKGDVHLHRTGISLNVGFDGQASGSISLDGLEQLGQLDRRAGRPDPAAIRIRCNSSTPSSRMGRCHSHCSASLPLAAERRGFSFHDRCRHVPGFREFNQPKTEVLKGAANGEFTVSGSIDTSYTVDLSTWLTAKTLTSS